MKIVAINMGILCDHKFSSLQLTHKSGIAESNGKCMLNFLKNYQTVFQSGSIILHSHQKYMSDTVLNFFILNMIL